MSRTPTKPTKRSGEKALARAYEALLADISSVVERARLATARSVNVVMTNTYWFVGRRIVEQEQEGSPRAAYGAQVLKRLASDLSKRFGRGFSERNLEQMRAFYLAWPISQTVSAKLTRARSKPSDVNISQIASAESSNLSIGHAQPREFALPWSHYARLLAVRNSNARAFYETEALRGGWTKRQLDRQIASQFYERTALSRDKAAMLRRGGVATAEDAASVEEQIKDPYVLEFLGLKDEYSESDLEASLIAKLEAFLLELGGDFTFVGRQRRLRVGDEWYRIDLLFFHRRLRCLVVIDLKLGLRHPRLVGRGMLVSVHDRSCRSTFEDQRPEPGARRYP